MAANNLQEAVNNQLHVIEPAYTGIPAGLLRRMGKAVRLGIGAALPIIEKHPDIAGIILGTANGGMEDCIKFLNQIIDYDEGMLTPGNFVQSTPNAIAGQLGLMSRNRHYNITHVHRGLAFENALLDALLLSRENTNKTYLVGGVDEISEYNYNIDYLAGWYKKENITAASLYQNNTPGSIAGEGAAMFLVNQWATNALARIKYINTLHSSNEDEVSNFITRCLKSQDTDPDVCLTGENGDNRLAPFYQAVQDHMPPLTGIARFKHLTGEYPSASAFAVSLALYLLNAGTTPGHLFSRQPPHTPCRNILLYNCYKGQQHSIIWISKN